MEHCHVSHTHVIRVCVVSHCYAINIAHKEDPHCFYSQDITQYSVRVWMMCRYLPIYKFIQNSKHTHTHTYRYARTHPLADIAVQMNHFVSHLVFLGLLCVQAKGQFLESS